MRIFAANFVTLRRKWVGGETIAIDGYSKHDNCMNGESKGETTTHYLNQLEAIKF